MYTTEPALLIAVFEGSEMERVGAVLSTLKIAESVEADALFPAISEAVPGLKSIPTVPSPVQLDNVTVLSVEPVPSTSSSQLAPAIFKLTSSAVSETKLAPV